MRRGIIATVGIIAFVAGGAAYSQAVRGTISVSVPDTEFTVNLNPSTGIAEIDFVEVGGGSEGRSSTKTLDVNDCYKSKNGNAVVCLKEGGDGATATTEGRQKNRRVEMTIIFN